MAATEPERWDLVRASTHDKWLARPFDDPNGVEMIVLSKDELLHALPRSNPCTPVPPAPDARLYETTAANGLNVRAEPSTTAQKVASLPLGTEVRAVVHNESWLRIVEGAYADRFIASAWAVPLP